MSTTQSPENQRVVDLANTIGLERLGIMSSQAWYDDPQGLLFTLSRYKFVSRMFRGFERVLEIGCGDAFYSRIVQQQVKSLTVSDHDPLFVDDIASRNPDQWKLDCLVFNPLVDKHKERYDGIYLLDVFEHIKPEDADDFTRNITSLLNDSGCLIIGAPSLASQKYASEISREGHVNCMSGKDFRAYFARFFNKVTLFSMNDEVLHTGFEEMTHYYFAMCDDLKK